MRMKAGFTIIWTTTPWTLPASMAVAFHPDEEYVALESGWRGLHRRLKAGADDVCHKVRLADAEASGPLSRTQAGAT